VCAHVCACMCVCVCVCVSSVCVCLGMNADWVSAGLTDDYTNAANAKDSFVVEGLYWFGNGYGQPASFNGFEPWAWYDSSEVKIIDADNPSASFPAPYTGYGSAANPYASRAKAETYLDTVMGYFIPRLKITLDGLDAADSLAVETADPSDTTVPAPIGIFESFLADDVMKVYPIPASSKLVFELWNSNYAMERIKIYDLTGKVVLDIVPYGANFHAADITSLNTGMYVVITTMETGETSQRKVLIE